MLILLRSNGKPNAIDQLLWQSILHQSADIECPNVHQRLRSSALKMEAQKISPIINRPVVVIVPSRGFDVKNCLPNTMKEVQVLFKYWFNFKQTTQNFWSPLPGKVRHLVTLSLITSCKENLTFTDLNKSSNIHHHQHHHLLHHQHQSFVKYIWMSVIYFGWWPT